MSQGLSLHIGLNSVDPMHYSGWRGDLGACEMDAEDMQTLATEKGFSTTTLLTAEATLDNVAREIKNASNQLSSGDIFFLSYAGHGGTIPDRSGDEIDNQDETWCLYDCQLIDDELYQLLSDFSNGVRIIVLSDSCHSGTVVRDAFMHGVNTDSRSNSEHVAYRNMPLTVARKTYRANKTLYDTAQEKLRGKDTQDDIDASVILISGCQDNQLSQDGAFNGLFTGTLLHVLDNNNFNGDYKALHSAVILRMPPTQTPNLFTVGTINPDFMKQAIFTI